MDLRYSEEYERFRDEVKRFLARNWPLQDEEAKLDFNQQAVLFRDRAIEAGFAARAIPRESGGSEQEPDVLENTIIDEEFRKVLAPAEIRGIGPSMLVPTLLEHGAPWQKEKFIPPTIRGDMSWCQGYSEPGAGSDLASLRTRAVLDGDEWVITGQKTWTTAAHSTDYMFCLCRTEPEASKHAGISYILIDMKSKGIEARPLTTITGQADFNEVFFDDVRVPARNIVGERGKGWIVYFMWSLGIAIAGGTANIQRNVIAERGLGLPRDRAADAGK